MEPATVLFIGRVPAKEDGFVSALRKRYSLSTATSGRQAVEVAEQLNPQVIVLDAVSMRTPGERICQQIKQQVPHISLIHIHQGPEKEADTPADALLVPPFTSRKLINCIERMLTAKHDEIIQCGPYSMNVSQRILHDNGIETQLTPKVACLVELFLKNPNKTFDRKSLMESIWQTDYMGDTRTLDVHIRWVRQALENGRPRMLNTVRGIGYRLDIPGSDGAGS
jgi:DNA-binding response OmpR family regulator